MRFFKYLHMLSLSSFKKLIFTSSAMRIICLYIHNTPSITPNIYLSSILTSPPSIHFPMLVMFLALFSSLPQKARVLHSCVVVVVVVSPRRAAPTPPTCTFGAGRRARWWRWRQQLPLLLPLLLRINKTRARLPACLRVSNHHQQRPWGRLGAEGQGRVGHRPKCVAVYHRRRCRWWFCSWKWRCVVGKKIKGGIVMGKGIMQVWSEVVVLI